MRTVPAHIVADTYPREPDVPNSHAALVLIGAATMLFWATVAVLAV
jgi:hypothetical protein